MQVGEPGPEIPDLVLEPQSPSQILIFAHLCLHILVFHSEDLHVPLPLPVDPSLIDLVPLGPLLKLLVKLEKIMILLGILYLLKDLLPISRVVIFEFPILGRVGRLNVQGRFLLVAVHLL